MPIFLHALQLAFAVASASAFAVAPSMRRNVVGSVRTPAQVRMRTVQRSDAEQESIQLMRRFAELESIRDEIDPALYELKKQEIAEAQMRTRDSSSSIADDECEVPEEKNMLQQIKDLGPAGAVSYALWELGFWTLSIPIGEFGFYQMGTLPAWPSPPRTRASHRLHVHGC